MSTLRSVVALFSIVAFEDATASSAFPLPLTSFGGAGSPALRIITISSTDFPIKFLARCSAIRLRSALSLPSPGASLDCLRSLDADGRGLAGEAKEATGIKGCSPPL